VNDLGVVVISYNTRDLLLGCLASVKEAVEGKNARLVVVDNASTDRSAEAVAREHPDVVLIRNPANYGFARACNQGMAVAGGRWILLLNSDARITREALEEMIGVLASRPDAGMVGPQLVGEDGCLQNSAAAFPTLATELLNKALLRRLMPWRYAGKVSGGGGARPVESVVGACMLVRRETVEQVGPLDPGYFFFLEETDWCLRMARCGWKAYVSAGARVVHLQGRSARRDPAAARIEYYRSRYRFFALHASVGSRAVLALLLPLRLCVELTFSLGVCLVTAFTRPRERERLAVRTRLLAWHLAGRPASWGLQGRGSGACDESSEAYS